MPDFDRLYRLSRDLAAMTAPNERQEGLGSWCVMVGEMWKEIAEMWDFVAPIPAPVTVRDYKLMTHDLALNCEAFITISQLADGSFKITDVRRARR